MKSAGSRKLLFHNESARENWSSKAMNAWRKAAMKGGKTWRHFKKKRWTATKIDRLKKKYKVGRSKLTFESAKMACLSEGLELASIFDEAENAALASLIKGQEVWMHFLPNLQANFQREIVQIRSKMWYIHTILTKMCTKYVGF